MGEMADSRTRAEREMMRLEHLVMPEIKEVHRHIYTK